MAIDITDLTSNVATDGDYSVTGDGIFDNIMETINTHIKAQFDADRIQSTDIANMYIGIVPSALSESVKILLQGDIAAKNAEVLEAQRQLYERQKEGFDDNKHQKVLDSALGAWGITYQDAGESLNIPSHLISSTSGAHIGLEKLFDNAMTNVRDATVDEPLVVN